MPRRNGKWKALAFLVLIVPVVAIAAVVEGRISGRVLDSSGRSVAKASVTVMNRATGFTQTAATDSAGVYTFPDLPVGTWELEVDAPGFRRYRLTGIAIDTSSALRADVELTIGDRTDSITVAASAVRAETADTEFGETLNARMIEAVPLNGRAFTDLLALQPGVVPATTITNKSIQAAGATTLAPSGNLNPGTISISGQREYGNAFTVNGANVVERFTMGTGVIPNLDSIEEFRILTANFEAEHGGYAGGLISVVTKSGSNQFHGSAFEFLRNQDLDSRNFFSPARAVYQQNQFGGSAGGPVFRNRVFFFADYQQTRLKQGVDTGLIQVPSLANRNGDFSDLAAQLTGTVTGQYWANLLSNKLGYGVSPGERYYAAGCANATQCVFPNAVIPQRGWSVPAQNLLKYIPKPNLPNGYFATSAVDQTLQDHKGAIRADANTRFGRASLYYFVDDYTLNDPYPTLQGGANVPDFAALNLGRAQLLTLSGTSSMGTRSVNQFQISYVRDVNVVGTPLQTVGASLTSQGFLTASGAASILPQSPGIVGVENVSLNNFTIGTTTSGLNQIDNSFEYRDNVAHVAGPHTIKFGGELMFTQVNASVDNLDNGAFSFTGSETGVDFADFLIGIPSFYKQGTAQPFYNRNRYGALFIQDDWRVRSRLTLSYGVRWDVIMPWYEKYNQIQSLVPGEQSLVFPGAPRGLVYPGDPGIPRTLAPTRWNNFSPRMGLAWSPHAQAGIARAVLGAPDQNSIRGGFGRYFTTIEGVSVGVIAGDAPYGITYVSPAPPLFNDPFVTASNGFANGQRFPIAFPSLNASPSHPNASIDWSQFLPISAAPGYYPGSVSPYAEQYTLSFQRQFGASFLVTTSYVGSEAHHLLVLLEANPGNPALCLALSQASQVAPGTPTCGPFGESNTYVSASGQTIHGTRAPFGSNFGSVDWLTTIGNSNFNALELSVRHASSKLDIQAGYTYGKSLDNSSSVSEQLNPLNYRSTYAPSAFDQKHNFVASFRYELPLQRLFDHRNQLTTGWVLSGIVRLGTGFPVTLTNASDNSLLGTQPDGVNHFGVDLPDVQPGRLNLNHDPRNGRPYFNTSLFSLQPLGQPGDAARRMFYGPGIENFDLAIAKSVKLDESRSLQLRIEAFNVFNHAQFFGPAAVNGEITSAAFGQVTSAAPPRLVQAAVKFSF